MTDRTAPESDPSTEPSWPARAARLAAELVDHGDLHDPAWSAAVAAVPRHRLVPTAYRQDPVTGAWQTLDTSTGAGLELVYSPETLITALADHGAYQVAVSSSTKPDLMLRMLETLDVRDGHRVLEIGTGTGYNAALLSHRLGADRVFSVDIDPELVETARTRLAGIGQHPTLATVDGAQGLRQHAPYDRIIATCSVPTIPWAWIDQLAPDGRVLADLKVHDTAGNLVDLRRLDPDRAEGRFTARWATFMTIRHSTTPTEVRPAADPAGRTSAERTTTAPAQPWWTHRVVWFLAQFTGLPTELAIGMRLDPDTRQPTAATLTAPDGSAATVELADHDGGHRLTETGPTPLWPAVERAHRQWTELGRPDWPRLGLTVTRTEQRIWLDDPAGPHTWTVPA
jgi:methyltransferase of ATP-grasp peptide maturase system